MEKNFSYIIIDELKIILETYRGELSLKDLIYYKRVLIKDERYDKNYNVIVNVKNAAIHIEQDVLSEFFKLLKKISPELGSRKSIILTADEKQSAKAQNLINMLGNLPIELICVDDINSIFKHFNIDKKNQSKIMELIET